MKLANRNALHLMAIAILVVGMIAGASAQAEHLRPSGPYANSRLGDAGTTGAGVQPATSGGSGHRSPQSVNEDDTGLTAQAKKWALEKWNTLKSMAGWNQPVNSPPAAAIALKQTATAAVPNVNAAPQAGSAPAPLSSTGVPPSSSTGVANAKSQSALPTAPVNAGNSSPMKNGSGFSKSDKKDSGYPSAHFAGANPGSDDATAPVARESAPRQATIDMATVPRTADGVQTFTLGDAAHVPRLAIDREDRLSPSRWALDSRLQKVMDDKVIHSFRTPDLVTTKQMQVLTHIKTGTAGNVLPSKDVIFSPKGKVSRANFDKIVRNLAPENPLKLNKFKELTAEETRFLTALMLFQQGDQCSAAVGILHKLSKSPGFEAEANYYMALCSRKLGLESDFFERASKILATQDVFYSKKILREIGAEVPYEFRDKFGLALFKVSTNDKIMAQLEPAAQANIAYVLAEYGAASERFKTSLTWAKLVPPGHAKFLQARFLEALGEYESGSKKKALQIQEDLIAQMDLDKANQEFQALVALNLARMYFQEHDFKNAHTSFLKVYKDHPLWLQSLTELGWAQLQSGDFEGAIGNMYSIQSPFFATAYKPESYVIRTIGYLDLCQYGDAYRTLSILEHDYKPWLASMEDFSKSHTGKGAYYKTVKSMLTAMAAVANKKDPGPKEVDGLPVPVIKEMARHRDFTNLQKALNREIDERAGYAHIEAETLHQLKLAQGRVTASRKQADQLRKNIALTAHHPEQAQNRPALMTALSQELDKLNDAFFYIDIYNEAVAALPDYKNEVIDSADTRIADLDGRAEKILRTRLLEMKTDLARDLDNNELLRYEAFSGSGENIRFQVAGGQEGKRVPANAIPKSKSLQWDFDGEYWEDEIGHYRSSLKNNCPAGHRDQAASDGGK